MKKCPYCGRSSEDNAEVCGHCYAGFPKETKEDKPEPDKKEKSGSRGSRRK